MEKLKQLRIFN